MKLRTILLGTTTIFGLAMGAGCGSDGNGNNNPCTLDFESDCPDSAAVCGASFTGGQSCAFEGLANCYESGARSYKLNASETVTVAFADPVSGVSVFLASQGMSTGTMEFFDASDTMVGSVTSGTSCSGATKPPVQTVTMTAPAVRATITAGTDVLWVDELTLNP